VTNPDWQPTFDAVHNVPGSTKQQPAKKTVQSLKDEAERARRRQVVDVAVPLGFVDTGDNDPWSWLSDFGTSVTEHTDAIANLEDIAAATNVTAAYVSDLDDMATAPRFAVSVIGFSSTTGTPPKYQDILGGVDVGSESFDAAHYGITPTFRPEKVNLVSQGHIYFTPIVVDRVGTVGNMRWIVGADTSLLSINYYEMALMIYNPDTGDLEKVWGSGDIKDGVADSTTLAEVFVDMGISQTCEPGQILFAAHQQTAPSALQASRRMACVPQANRPRTVPLLDAACYVAEDHSEGIPSSIDFSSLTRENRFIPWVSISVDAVA
jgi:hypothetical protein